MASIDRIRARWGSPWLLLARLVFFHAILIGVWEHKAWLMVGGVVGVAATFFCPKGKGEADPPPPVWSPGTRRLVIAIRICLACVLAWGLWTHNRIGSAISITGLVIILSLRLRARRRAG
ncbi:MAG: hypothetical protein AB7E47_09770 [Desulfovibrionaceae bacterium]